MILLLWTGDDLKLEEYKDLSFGFALLTSDIPKVFAGTLKDGKFSGNIIFNGQPWGSFNLKI